MVSDVVLNWLGKDKSMIFFLLKASNNKAARKQENPKLWLCLERDSKLIPKKCRKKGFQHSHGGCLS